MTKHTPGPWTILESDDTGWGGFVSVVADGAPDLAVAVCYHGGGDSPSGTHAEWSEDSCAESRAVAESNARLIASAPDLLSALEMAVATIERIAPKHGPFSSVDGTLSVARAALARAEGRG